MRFMVIVKASKNSEAGVLPSRQLLEQMGKFNEELAKAGVLIAGEGLQASSKGARVQFSGAKRTVVDGPFAETKELIAGYWMWRLPSLAAAIEWVKRCPSPHEEDCEIEIRQVFEAEDFGAEFTPELREQEQRVHAQAEVSQPSSAPGLQRTVTPHLICAGAAEAIEFYKKAFEAVELMRLPGTQGRIMHACIQIGDSPVMLVDEMPECGALGPKSLRGSPVTVHLNVPDVDRFVARAVAAGARVTMPVADMFWGDRYGRLEDPFGHQWSVASHVRDMTPEEIAQAAAQIR
jgi:uncharacterized glyoxalase superfamily protein PhnB